MSLRVYYPKRLYTPSFSDALFFLLTFLTSQLNEISFVSNFADAIITQGRPGDQFVSIDGKRTYFNIGPTDNGPANFQDIQPTRPIGESSMWRVLNNCSIIGTYFYGNEEKCTKLFHLPKNSYS